MSLLALAGVGMVALGFGLTGAVGPPSVAAPDGERPQLGSEADSTTSLAGPRVVTVPVALRPGWSVPSLAGTDGNQSATDGVETHAAHLDSSDPGTATVGATMMVAEGATMAIVHGAADTRLAYRSEVDGRWSEWETLTIGDEEGPDGLPGDEGHEGPGVAEGDHGSAPAAGPLWLGADATEMEFVVIAGDTSSFEVTFLGSSNEDGTTEAAPQPVPAPAGATAGAAGTPTAPPIIPREEWASGDWNYQKEACDEGPSTADHLQAVVIHHTVTTNAYSESDVDDLLRAIYYSHVVVNGWCDIGYNFVVDRFGRIWEARTGSIEHPVIGGHARGFNTSTVGVALLGQHHPGAQPSAASPSSASQAAIKDLAHWKLGAEGVDPAGMTWLRNRSSRQPLRLAGLSWHYVPTILGHRDLGVTSCPGDHSMGLVRGLPATLAAERDLALPYSFVNWQAHSHGPGFVVADASGGVRPAGTATPWSQAPAGLPAGFPVIAVGGTLSGGYLLSAAGDVVGFGSAPAIAEKPAGSATPVDLVVRADGQSGWVLDGAGVLHGFGGVGNVSTGVLIESPVAAAIDDDGRGYVLDNDGSLYPAGGARTESVEATVGAGSAIDVATRADGSGWVLDSRGRLHGFGGASSTRVDPPEAVRAVSVDETGSGGWVLDAHGQLWPFGGARLVFPVSTNASAGHAVDVDNVGAVYSPDFVNGESARFIAAIHRLFLGRDPSIEETDHQVTELEQGARRSDLTSALSRSSYWSAGAVDEMYRNALGREADVEGRAYWLSQISSGLRLQDLGTYFYGSQEYANAAGSTEAYVAGLYDVLLHRPPDPEGLDYWVGLLERGQAEPPDVANGFYASIESRRDRAGLLHQRILGSVGGVATEASGEYWAERLLASGDAGVAAEMAASSSYYRLVVDGPEP